MSARKIRRARRRALAAGTAVGLAAAPAVASADSVVTNTDDSGAGSLRQAIDDSNADLDADTITFAPGVTGPITLNSGLVVMRSTTVVGPGASSLSVVSPSDLAFFFNDATGGSSKLELRGMTIEGHNLGSGSAGGAVLVGGQTAGLTLRNVTIENSTAANQGGGVAVLQTPLTLIDSTVTGNSAGTTGGGIYGKDSDVEIMNSTITGNSSSDEGGGIELAESASTRGSALSITDSRLSGNSADNRGGGISVSAADGPMSIVRSTISGNHTYDGGGLYFGYGSALTVDSSTFSGNTAAGDGGGMLVFAPDGDVNVRNSTVSGNTAGQEGAGIYSFGYFDNPVTISNSTIAANTGSGAGGGIYRFGFDGTGVGYEGPDEITLRSSIVADNGVSDLADGPLASGSFRTAFSLIGATGTAAVTETAPGTNQLSAGSISLGPLANNGGPTQTLLPPLDSPAVDAGSAFGLSDDQRGLARTVDQAVADGTGSDGTDIGAVELADTTLDGGWVSAKQTQKQKPGKIIVKVTAGALEKVTARASGFVKLGKKKLKLTKPKAEVAADNEATLKLKPATKKGTRKIGKALAEGRKVKATVSVTLTDAVGNDSKVTLKVRLKPKVKKKG